MIKNILTLSLAMLFFQLGYSQTEQERQQFIQDVNPSSIQKVKSYLENKAQKNKEEVEAYLLTHPNVEKTVTVDGETKLLERIDSNGRPIYLVPHNFNGGLTIGVNHLHNNGSLGLNIEGQNITALIWDGGYARETHQEFSDRVTYGEFGKSLSDHGTHVGGTIISEGLNNTLKGMAPQGSLKSFRFDEDTSEMFEEASNGFLISNHSYGTEVTEDTPLNYYGRYEESATGFDFITSVYPYYLPVVSAGNDRGKGFNRADNGFDLLTDRTLSKNVMTVGAVEGIFFYSNPSSVVMSSFSSYGPTDDGRIKPDIVAKGVAVNSLGSSSDSDTGTKSGTSMSAPMVTGGLMLLHQLYNQEQSSFMKSATIKGLALMTTKEAGDTPGPDYRFGWGLLDVKAAAQMVLELGQSSSIQELELSTGESYEETFTAKDADKLSIALSWTDQPGQGPGDNADEDDRTPVLVNDLDIKVTSASGTEFFPYKLDPVRPNDAATTGVNSVDNIEIIEIDAPAGNYTVQITHKESLLGTQPYSLLVNGATPQTASSGSEEISGLSIFPNPANNYFNVTFDAATVASKISVQVFNTLGQMVIDRPFDNTGKFNERINVSSLNSGIYFVKVGDLNVSSTRKLIIR